MASDTDRGRATPQRIVARNRTPGEGIERVLVDLGD